MSGRMPGNATVSTDPRAAGSRENGEFYANFSQGEVCDWGKHAGSASSAMAVALGTEPPCGCYRPAILCGRRRSAVMSTSAGCTALSLC